MHKLLHDITFLQAEEQQTTMAATFYLRYLRSILQHKPRLRPSLSRAPIPPRTRLAVGQIGPESRFTVKRSICLSNGGEGEKNSGISKRGQTWLLYTKTRGPSYYLCMQRDV